MIADGGAGCALWQRIIRLPSSRFLMLGTPNLGSYEAVRWLTGFNPTQAKLSLLDITQSTDDIIGLVARYPGLLELLALRAGRPGLCRCRQALAEPAPGNRRRWPTAEARRPAGSRRYLEAAQGRRPRPALHALRCRLPTGHRRRLPAELGSDWWPPDRKRLDFIATREGDGTVSWDSGRLPGVPVWYVDDTAHDALCAQRKAFPGYLDLLVNGQTDLLPSNPPVRSRGAGAAIASCCRRRHRPTACRPPDDIASFGFSGSGRRTAETETRRCPTIEVSHPPWQPDLRPPPGVVGHYQGDTVVSAEAVLDRQLKRRPDAPPRSRHLPRSARQPYGLPQRLAHRQAQRRHRRRPRPGRRAEPRPARDIGARRPARFRARQSPTGRTSASATTAGRARRRSPACWSAPAPAVCRSATRWKPSCAPRSPPTAASPSRNSTAGC